MVRWENDNRWRDGITSYIKMKIKINNENSRKCSGDLPQCFQLRRPRKRLAVRKCGSADVRKVGGRAFPYIFMQDCNAVFNFQSVKRKENNNLRYYGILFNSNNCVDGFDD